jgi:putative zinc finger/helix-turn-helix YgiT family protein
MNKTHNCSFCNSIHTHEVEYSENFKVGRKQLQVTGLKKIVCGECKSEFVPAKFYDYNLNLFIDAESKVKNVVSPGSLKDLREMWGLSQKEASKIFGAGVSSFGKWESSQANMSTPAALLIKVACSIPEVVPFLSQLANVKLKQDVHGFSSLNRPELKGAYEAIQLVAEATNANVYVFPNKNAKTIPQSLQGHKPASLKWIDADVTRTLKTA